MEKQPPKTIYLQWLNEEGEKPDEITWSANRIHKTDIKYTRK